MSDHDDKSQTTPELLEAGRRLGQAVAGVLKEMSEALGSLTSASSPTQTAIGSSSTNGIRSQPKLFEMDESPALSSSAPAVASSSTSSQRRTELPAWDPIKVGQDLHNRVQVGLRNDDLAERERVGRLIVHFRTFGTSEQLWQTSKRMIHDLDVKGYEIHTYEVSKDA